MPAIKTRDAFEALQKTLKGSRRDSILSIIDEVIGNKSSVPYFDVFRHHSKDWGMEIKELWEKNKYYIYHKSNDKDYLIYYKDIESLLLPDGNIVRLEHWAFLIPYVYKIARFHKIQELRIQLRQKRMKHALQVAEYVTEYINNDDAMKELMKEYVKDLETVIIKSKPNDETLDYYDYY